MGATFAAQASCVVMVAQHSTLYSSATVGGDFCLHYYSN